MKFQNIFFTLLLMLSWFAGATWSQVNTENLRKLDLKPSFHAGLQADLNTVSGNSEFLKMTGNVRLDYVANSHYAFGVVQYQRGIQNEKTFIHKGFAHLREIYILNRRLRIEWFAQKEFNEFIALKDRSLLGTGLRTAALTPDFLPIEKGSIHFFIGIGLMWENELMDATPAFETKIYRSTNYLTLDWKIKNLIKLGIITYYQVDLKNGNDYRILNDSRLTFHITQHLAFQTSVNFRYDNAPPVNVKKNVKKYDLEIRNGLRLDF